MRLSEWRAAAPSKDAVAPKVTAVVDPVIAAFGVGDDPDGWIAWGEEPGQRYDAYGFTAQDPDGFKITITRGQT